MTVAFHQSENSESLCGGAAFARPDYDRAMRQGAGEVIYGEGKTAEQIAAIASSLMGAGQPRVLATRVDAKKADAVAALWGDDGGIAPCAYYETARLVVFGGMPAPDGDGVVAIACAGTSDLPVAEEAALTAEFLGNEVRRFYDVGVAGIHRLGCGRRAARGPSRGGGGGMEGALASVVGVSSPRRVIAVPTSVGYGASFGGVTALLAMLNSCASGVSVVNIDTASAPPSRQAPSITEFPTGINLRRFPPSAGASRAAPS